MKWIISMKIKDYVRNWSNQEIETKYEGVDVRVSIRDTTCIIILEGDENVEKTFRLVWELLYLYDGYFYEPISYDVDGIKKNPEDLIMLDLYKTDKKWYGSELLGRSERDLSTDVISKYDKFRNESISDRKMTKSVVNAFYYLTSEAYGKINVNHRLSLLLNIADGFVINTYKETNNIKASYDRFFKKTIDISKLQKGISLLGIDPQTYKWLLTEERNAFDHYVYSEDCLSTFIHNADDRVVDYATWYFVYVLELVTRINFLKEAGVVLKQGIVDYAIESINDWIIYENELDEECTTHRYQFNQVMKKMGIVMR